MNVRVCVQAAELVGLVSALGEAGSPLAVNVEDKSSPGSRGTNQQGARFSGRKNTSLRAQSAQPGDSTTTVQHYCVPHM